MTGRVNHKPNKTNEFPSYFSDEERSGLAKVEYNSPDNDGLTPLLVASKYGHSAIVSTMLAHPGFDNSARNKEGKTALYLAAEYNRLKVLEVCNVTFNPFQNNGLNGIIHKATYNIDLDKQNF